MKKRGLSFISAVAVPGIIGAASIGTSTPGVFFTPPEWATPLGQTSIEAKDMPLGYYNGATNILRLGTTSALGLVATLDAAMERWWGPIFTDNGLSSDYICYPGPVSAWATNDYSKSPWRAFPTLFPSPKERMLTNETSRIFPQIYNPYDARSMLSVTRERVRNMVVWGMAETNNQFWGSFGEFEYGSSIFGGIDFVQFSWRDRHDAIEQIKLVANDLCLDWTCTRDCRWREMDDYGIIPMQVNIVVRALVDPPYTDFPRVLPSSEPVLTNLTSILEQQLGYYSHNPDWLTKTNNTDRIDADDVGWINTILALMDKSYLIFSFNGLPKITFKGYEANTSITGTTELDPNSASFHLSWDTLTHSCKAVMGEVVGFSFPETYATKITTNTVYMEEIEFSSSNPQGSVSVSAFGTMKLSVQPELFPALDSGVTNEVLVAVDIDDNNGPYVEIAIKGPTESDYNRYNVVYILPETSVIPVDYAFEHISASVNTIYTDDRARTFATNETPSEEYYTLSKPAWRPITNKPGWVKKINLQGFGYREISGTDGTNTTNVSEYRAMGSQCNLSTLNNSAWTQANTLIGECKSKSRSVFGYNVANMEGTLVNLAQQIENQRHADAANMSRTTGTWSVNIPEPHLLQTYEDGEAKLYSANSRVELQKDTSGGYIYGSVTASTQGSVSTNMPSGKVECEMDFSAAIYWNWQNLPLNQSATQL